MNELVASLSVLLSGPEPPTELRLFAAGWNETTKGRFLFDEAAAGAVMSAYQDQGVDMMIDLEHLSLDPESKSYDPDARGWGALEVRNGELWLVKVTWTEDGAARLRQRRQRYISPAFAYEKDSRRVTAIVNAGITGLPATHHTPALVAANRSRTALAVAGGTGMDGAQFAALAEALGLGSEAKFEDVIATIGAMLKKLKDAASGEKPAEKALDPAAAEMQAAASRLTRLTGKGTAIEALFEVESWKKSHVELVDERAKLAREKLALEAGDRVALTARLVTECGETPSTAWADFAETKPSKPAEPWASMPLEALKARVEKLSGKGAPPPRPPTDGVCELSARELAMCAEMKVDPKDYAARKAATSKKAS